MNELDKWSAEAVGIEYNETNEGMIIYDPNGRGLLDCQWTLTDARCMEIFRNWWLSQNKRRCVTMTCDEVWYFVPAAFAALDDINAKCKNEIDCAKAIMEASK